MALTTNDIAGIIHRVNWPVNVRVEQMDRVREWYRQDVNTLLAEIERLQAERDTAMRALSDLTPGGSEFANSVQNCVRWVKDRESSLSRMLVKTNRELHEARAEIERLRAGQGEGNA